MKDLRQCKTREDFVKHAHKHGACVTEGGSHTIVSTKLGECAIPRHRGDLATGTRFSIIRTFILLGLGCLIVLLTAYGAGII